MTIEQLNNKLTELKVPEVKYYLHEQYGSTNDQDKPALTIKRGKYTIEYEVYYKERGEVNSSRTFTTEDEACEYLFKQVVDNWTFEKINKS